MAYFESIYPISSHIKGVHQMHGETKIANVVGEQAFSFLEIQISL